MHSTEAGFALSLLYVGEAVFYPSVAYTVYQYQYQDGMGRSPCLGLISGTCILFHDYVSRSRCEPNSSEAAPEEKSLECGLD